MGVVNFIPFSYGASFIRQTGRCLNDRLREHNASLRAAPSGHLAVRLRDCERRFQLLL